MSFKIDRVAVAAVASACVSLAAPAAAHAVALTPAAEVMRDLCLAHDSRQIDVIDAADGMGFTPMPGNIAKGLSRMEIGGVIGRTKVVNGTTVMLVTGLATDAWGDLPGLKGRAADACLVIVQNASPQLPQDAARLLGATEEEVGPPSSEAGFVYSEEADGLQPMEGPEDPALPLSARSGRLRMLMAATEKDVSMIALIAARAEAGGQPAAAAASQENPFNDFKSICIDKRGVIADSIQAADAAGWMQVPDEGLEMPYPMTSGTVRVKSTENDFETLLAGPGRFQLNLQLLTMNLCAVVQEPPADTVLLKSVEDWVGLAPVEVSPDGARIYLFTEENGRHVPLPTSGFEAALSRKAKAGPVSIVFIQRANATGEASYVSYGVLTKVQNVSLPSAYAMACDQP